MRLHVLADGIPIGSARFDPPDGLAHARLEVLPAYARVRPLALASLTVVANTRYWNAVDGDFADWVAAAWPVRLALVDDVGREWALPSVVLLERPWRDGPDASPHVTVVADFRSDLARVEAFLASTRGDDGGRSRPAA